MMSGEGKLVCVTGASGYIASWLVKFLLLRRYTVNATVRRLDDPKKVEHLLALEGAKERLRLFEADLMEEGSFDSAVSGCNGVFHTASPCFFGSRDPEAELLEPAVRGTLNVLGSCARAVTVKRVVLTSSVAAVLGNNREITPDVVVDESWFSDPNYRRREKNWYALSKTLAEEAAWKYAREKGMDLVCINPAFVLGPLLQSTLNESCAMLLDFIKGGKANKIIGYRTVNVKDVAIAHIQAFETVSAFGRYCLVESTVPFFEVLKILRELYPTLQLPDKSEKNDASGILFQVSRKKAESLGTDFISFRTTLKETIDSLKEKNFISF